MDFDVVIYGSTPAALAAAVQAARMGARAVVVSPETRIGGLTTGGLGQTDIGNKSAFGGIAREFYRDVAKWYADKSHWTRENCRDYFPDGQCAGTKDGGSMWTFEPSAALAILEGWERRDKLDIRRGERLDRTRGIVKSGARIVSIATTGGSVYRGKVFIDATYEGDLMAAAGVTCRTGREANSEYGETANGIQSVAPTGAHHNFHNGVSPYVVEGDRASGLLPGVEPHNAAERDGDGDARVQAYCFRMCLTDDPANRIPFAKPASYDERDYELLFREYAALERDPSPQPPGCLDGAHRLPFIMSRMPNRKTDSNNRTAFSSDFIGGSVRWPEASDAERAQIFAAHLAYQRGLMWTLANHPRIPADVRDYFSRWGTCRDEFADGPGDGWQGQLYVREARRMVGETVITERHCRGIDTAARPVAMAAYTMDSHHVRRVETADGFVRNEGNVEDALAADGKSPMTPYGIDYGAIVPKKTECENLLVPVCLSATHIAFGSIRMEPVFFALGQAAGTAASLAAAANNAAVQDIPYATLRARLLADGQVIRSDSSARELGRSAAVKAEAEVGGNRIHRKKLLAVCILICLQASTFACCAAEEAARAGSPVTVRVAAVKPGSWHGYISYTMQGTAFGLNRFWTDGSGLNFRTENLDHSRTERSKFPEYLETCFDKKTNKTLTWNGRIWVDAMGNPAPDNTADEKR